MSKKVLTKEQMIAKIKRLERKVKTSAEELEGKKNAFNTQMKAQADRVAELIDQVDETKKNHSLWLDKYAKSLGDWGKDTEKLNETKITLDRVREQRDDAIAERHIAVSLALVNPHHYLIARETFNKVHEGKGMGEVSILTTVSSMQSNYAFLFRVNQ